MPCWNGWEEREGTGREREREGEREGGSLKIKAILEKRGKKTEIEIVREETEKNR